jgi:hypothetical protein
MALVIEAALKVLEEEEAERDKQRRASLGR